MSEPQITDLPGVGPTTAEKLAEAGFDTVLTIAVAHPSNIIDAAGLSDKAARKVIIAARELLNIDFITGLEAEEKINNRGFMISTGSKEFDIMMGGGIKSGGITEVYGEYGSGKTQVAHQLCVNVIKQFKDRGEVAQVIYIDTENTFTPVRIRQMARGVGIEEDYVLENIKVIQAFNSDHQTLLAEEAEKLIKRGDPVKMMVVDSLMAHFRAEYIGRGTLADRQQKVNKHMRTLQKTADLYDIVVFCTNQVSASPGVFYGNPIQAIGGNIVGHNSRERIYLRRGKKIKDEVSRVAALVDSPYLPDGAASYFVREEGIVDL